MRLARIILEGLLVAFLAALSLFFLRHHLVGGLVAGIVICLVGIGAITSVERRKGVDKRDGPQERVTTSTLEFGTDGTFTMAPGSGVASIKLPAGTFIEATTMALASTIRRSDALEVELLSSERFEVGGQTYQLAVAVQFRITNLTSQSHRVSVDWEVPSPGIWDSTGLDWSAIDLFQATHPALADEVGPADGDQNTISGWRWKALPVWPSEVKGHRAYTVIVMDDEGGSLRFDQPSWVPQVG